MLQKSEYYSLNKAQVVMNQRGHLLAISVVRKVLFYLIANVVFCLTINH